MKCWICAAFLLFAVSLTAQQQAPPYSTPPRFPQEQRPTQPMPPDTKALPPDTKAPSPETLSSADIEQQIQKKLTTEPLLAKNKLKADVDDNSVVLSGTVDDECQHDLALRIAQSYTGARKIVDNIQIRERT